MDMIPRIIHYCWFGGKPLPRKFRRCLASWRRHLPGYEFKEWNEGNFDVAACPFTAQAYAARKFAFVADYVRLHALLTEGGIYLDTDVELLGSLDPFLAHPAFVGFETESRIGSAIMASEPNHPFIAGMLAEYHTMAFINADNSLNLAPNTELLTRRLIERGLKANNSMQNPGGLIMVYPTEYFCPKDHRNGRVSLTERSVCVHHYAGSWLSPAVRLRHSAKLLVSKLLPRQP